MKISVQSLFEDYEDDTVELRRDADTARILEKTMAKLPNARKKRPLRLVLIAAAIGDATFLRMFQCIADEVAEYLSETVGVGFLKNGL